ncbi:autophagy-related protein 33 [[Candida] jaroonii]|uniref:Autophagy-related protein 33 n=1 Tax=[Candida] jaroonii TaxID=467808 RepID=A0ACA9YET9_9ASCO|nr:autophagy-related protein 33 [[Candida] jaroonii]
MAGTCITSIKFIGLSSIGLLSTSLAYQSIKQIPQIINELNYKLSSGYNNLSFLKIAKIINFGLVNLAVGCFYMTFKYSPKNEKHPYLIYSILGSLIGFGYTYYNTWNKESKLFNFEIPDFKPESKEKVVPRAQETSVPAEDDLSKSYIHVSEESSNNSTPNNSVPTSPKIEQSIKPEQSIDEEINLALFKKQTVHELDVVRSFYLTGSYILGATFTISSIGIIGDLFR